mmetsp:Transcript_29021/g.40074  ORF Transcript_29021/g.40074 Transcript_29021/m.40074 type:complete len:450 (-) Transcript_29021:101-1450(-)|eukprot:CAMPEP_0196595956 /NCGR_PEP_ID=MMETSP1081-20130531/83366_1 /TAXON_ID=36882 /ORGANISM="Pyramimonas amylifera, Strain CCMP720" /LENGTH=449 /DNA_ID=CAMNT_0041920755 /DNA_START=127 /DNA_END=1476 /DNA_ORIENTATION=+
MAEEKPPQEEEDDEEELGEEDDNQEDEEEEESGGVEAQADMRRILEQIRLNSADKSNPTDVKHAFWETQPVVQFKDEGEGLPAGPIDAPLTPADVKQEPYNLPSGYKWRELDLIDADTVEEVYKLLNLNYVEDDDNMFRFDYSREFLKWALQPPGFKKQWHIGVCVASSDKLVAFITAVPAGVRAEATCIPMVEINFLCVHKKLRCKRLAPVLIKEITRRVNMENVWQAAYTAGVVLPKPLATCRYHHRSLNPKKLIEVGFSALHKRMTMSRTIKLFKLPTEPLTPGFRKMKAEDVPGVTMLLRKYLAKFRLAPDLNEEDVRHWILPRDNVIDAFVVQSPETKAITDFVSYYCLPSTIIGNNLYKTLKAAYCYYNVAESVSLKDLMNDALIMAKLDDYDVFNALDIMQNEEFLKDLKFGIGDGYLQYYLYNWRMGGGSMLPQDVGLVLL